MEEQLISLEAAILAKKLGFGGKGLTLPYCYWEDKLVSIPNNNLSKFNPEDFYSAPTQSLLQKWLRENHGINIGMTFHQLNGNPISYDYCLHYKYGCQSLVTKWSQIHFQSYEQALEAGLIDALKLIK